LPFASKLADRYLSRRGDENGFFAMIEGSQIDWACHSNDGKLTVKETLDFGNAIQEVLNFAIQDGNTLVIVTADHETGGMAIQEGSTFKKIVSEFNTNGHTATLIPVFAYGPSAELFRGIYENTAIYDKMRQALGWKKMPEENGH
jgi:alkaline phosphatase